MGSNSKTILYASDNQFMHIIITDTLKPHNINVIDVYSGIEALQSLADLTPDLVLTDLDMPGMSGLDLCRSITQSTQYKNIPVVVYSGSETEEDIQSAFLAGARGYIVKKFCKEVLAKKIIHYIR